MLILTILFYTFVVVNIIQAVYYSYIFSHFSFYKENLPPATNTPVSVIICAKNEAENLKQFLPSILNQDYPKFEVVLINDASNDQTLEVMEQFKEQHSNIKIVNVKSIEAFWGNKKYALTLGIKAASYNTLLFTDADCKPISKQWISTMSRNFSNSKSIIIGYGAYNTVKGSFLNKLIRFETLLTAIQYFSFAKMGQPYMAVGRNLAYTKETFFIARGFMDHMNIKSGDDDLFVNQIATAKNTSICAFKDSFTSSIPEQSLKSWILQKRRHISTAKHYKTKHKLLLGLFFSSQFLFWTLGITLLCFMFNFKVVFSLIILRFILHYTCMIMASKKLNEKDLILLFPILELFLILSQLYIFINNLVSKPNHWK